MPTISVENYLKAIYQHQQRGGERVKTKEVADHLEISLPSVTSMLKSLAREGLVDYQRYHGVTLTEAGRLLALSVIRKHRLIELFLVDTLDYTWDEVHNEAERLEHAISDELAQRIERYLGSPRFDPHGDPIPTADGQIFPHEAIPLDQADVGVKLRVKRVLDQDPEVLRYLERVGLTPQTDCTIQEVLPFDGQMFLVLDGDRHVSLSNALATRLLVTPLEGA